MINRHPYDWVCKVHGKKSLHLGQGNLWRAELFETLLGGLKVNGKRLSHVNLPRSAKIGLVGPANSLQGLNDKWALQNNIAPLVELLDRCGFLEKKAALSKQSFVAGSMFWFRPDALRQLASFGLTDKDFGVELGRIDGTPAHAMERMFGFFAHEAGYNTAEMTSGAAISANIKMTSKG